MSSPSHSCRRLPATRSAPVYSFTQTTHVPISPRSDSPMRVTHLPTLMHTVDYQQAPNPRVGLSHTISQSLPSPLSAHSSIVEIIPEARVAEPDTERCHDQYSEDRRNTPNSPFNELPLNIDNTMQMYELMKLEATPRHCEMIVETIQGLIRCNDVVSSRNKKLKTDVLVEHLFYWTSMTLHPFVILICTIQYVELLKAIHPSISFTGRLRDAMLRVIFSAFLIAIKMVSDVCYANAAFIRHTPWTLEEINSMEAELLAHIQYRSYISPISLLHRAKCFWLRPEDSIHTPEDDAISFDSTMSD